MKKPKKPQNAEWIGLPVHLDGRFFKLQGRRYLATWWKGHHKRTFLFDVLDDGWYMMAQWKGTLSLATVIERWGSFLKKGRKRKVAE